MAPPVVRHMIAVGWMAAVAAGVTPVGVVTVLAMSGVPLMRRGCPAMASQRLASVATAAPEAEGPGQGQCGGVEGAYDVAVPPDEAADDERPGDDAKNEHGHRDDDAELVIKLNPAVSESLAELTQRPSEILRQFIQPITSTGAASFSKSMLAPMSSRAAAVLRCSSFARRPARSRAVAMAGRAGARLAERLRMPTSRESLLRLLRTLPDPQPGEGRRRPEPVRLSLVRIISQSNRAGDSGVRRQAPDSGR
jgi:hypothetical protein